MSIYIDEEKELLRLKWYSDNRTWKTISIDLAMWKLALTFFDNDVEATHAFLSKTAERAKDSGRSRSRTVQAAIAKEARKRLRS